MKEFNNKQEREYLTILNEMSKMIEVNLGSFLAKCVLKEDRIVQIDSKKTNLIFNLKKENATNFVKDLSIIVSLIETLRNEGLIFIHTNPAIRNRYVNTDKENSSIERGTKITGLTDDKNLQPKIDANPSTYGKWELPTTLADYLMKYVDEFCYVRPELIDYVNNNFRTSEQARFKTTLGWTQLATLLAFVGLVIAVVIPFLTTPNANDKPNDITYPDTRTTCTKEKIDTISHNTSVEKAQSQKKTCP
jgi:hypothetical protein